jgi:hypothetical protein
LYLDLVILVPIVAGVFLAILVWAALLDRTARRSGHGRTGAEIRQQYRRRRRRGIVARWLMPGYGNEGIHEMEDSDQGND